MRQIKLTASIVAYVGAIASVIAIFLYIQQTKFSRGSGIATTGLVSASALTIKPSRQDMIGDEAHLALGEKFVPEFGWVKEDIEKKLTDGLWFTNGQWMKWTDVSNMRIEAFKARELGRLGNDFRYAATHHFTIANNLSDAEFEKDLIQALELCLLDQRMRLYEPFKLGEDEPLNVIVFQNKSEFSAYCRKIGSNTGDSWPLRTNRKVGMAPYKEKFPVGSTVRVVALALLQEFKRTWEFHNPLRAEQLAYAGLVAQVAKVGFYHGGDVLYELAGIPGIWHEQCLESLVDEQRPMTFDEIEEHNRAFQEGSELVKGGLLLTGSRPPAGVDETCRARLDRALSLFARVLEINPKNWSAMWLAGKVHQRLGDNSAALAWFSQAHRMNPSQVDVAREASICAMSLGRSGDAISYAQDALHTKPSDGGLQANLALAFLLAGRAEEAKTIIERAMMIDPADSVSLTLGHMIDHFVDCGERPPSTTAALDEYWRKRKPQGEIQL